jgi:putative nucleotidyltransferase with HDIG domain
MMLFDLFVNYYLVTDFEVYTALLLNFICGTLAVFIVDEEGSRLKVLLQGILVSIPVVVSAVCLEFTRGFVELWKTVLFAGASGVLSLMILTVVLPGFEYMFGILTNFRLGELTNHKSKLIKCLIERAPGTFNHTLIVASLAEACSNAIGLNPLLARACAYYHDIGKIKNVDYFAENQSGYNPHDELSPELSTDIIRAHARDGADFIRKWHFPEVLAETAEQHHGTLPIRYFYAKALKFTDGELDVEDYSYYGPKPKTKINAIIMICDACEAKVRTVGNRTHENVDKAVKEIIEERMDLDQFTDCDITFRELDIIRNSITNALAGVYHDRVKYPKLKKGKNNAN